MKTKPTRKTRIMVVDDDLKLTHLLKLNLELNEDFRVLVENDAAEALSVAERFQPDLLLLDVMMPKVDGGELAARMQARPSLKSVPIVFLTAAVTPNEVSLAHGLIGGLQFIAKPVDCDELTRCIRAQLPQESLAVPHAEM